MRVIIVTGLSGAGKTHAMDVLEDMGFYCIDNMPPALIGSFVDLASNGKGIDKAAFVVDVRGGSFFDDLKDALDNLKASNVDYQIIYLEATDRVLARRYNETRRAHPLSEGESVMKGIKREKARLRTLRENADFIIDTSNLKNSQLVSEIANIVSTESDKPELTVNIMSFGYKHGMPVTANIVFDARFIPNPYYVSSLKKLTGNNKKVSDFVLRQEVTGPFMDSVTELVQYLIPHYMKEGKYNLSICFGCTGGHHRSVALANELNRRLSSLGIRTSLEHRDL